MKAYIIKYPDGTLNPNTIGEIKEKLTLSDKVDVIEDFEALKEKNWKDIRKEGFSCVCIRITEIKQSK